MAGNPNLLGSGLSLIHLNTQSILPKFEEIQLTINNLCPDIFCVTESWLSHAIPNGLVALDQYTLYRLDRLAHRRGGGLISHFKNEINVGIDADKFLKIWISKPNIEMQMFDVKIRNIKKMILINTYRPPPGMADIFLDTLTAALQSVRNLHEYEIYILGDCNLLYNQVNSTSYKKLKDFESRLVQTRRVFWT